MKIKLLLASALFAITPLNLSAQQSPNNQAQKAVKCEVLNCGVGGNTTVNMLERVDADVVAVKPDLTIIMVGTNDMLNSKKLVPVEEYEKNYTELIRRVKSCGSQVLLLSSLPADSEYLGNRHDVSKYSAHPTELLANVRDIVERLAEQNDCYFFDLHGVFTSMGLPKHNEDLYIRNVANSGVEDGVHPTALGYKLIGESVWGFLTENNLHTKFKKIACFGDSITNGSGAKGVGTVTGENYPSYLNTKLNE